MCKVSTVQHSVIYYHFTVFTPINLHNRQKVSHLGKILEFDKHNADTFMKKRQRYAFSLTNYKHPLSAGVSYVTERP